METGLCSLHDLQGQFSFKLRRIVKTRGSSMLLIIAGDSSADVNPRSSASSSASNVEVSSLFQSALDKMNVFESINISPLI